MYIYTYTHTLYIYIYVYINVYVYMYKYVHIYIYMHIIFVYCIYRNIHAYYIYIYIYINTYTCICTCIHIKLNREMMRNHGIGVPFSDKPNLGWWVTAWTFTAPDIATENGSFIDDLPITWWFSIVKFVYWRVSVGIGIVRFSATFWGGYPVQKFW